MTCNIGGCKGQAGGSEVIYSGKTNRTGAEPATEQDSDESTDTSWQRKADSRGWFGFWYFFAILTSKCRDVMDKIYCVGSSNFVQNWCEMRCFPFCDRDMNLFNSAYCNITCTRTSKTKHQAASDLLNANLNWQIGKTYSSLRSQLHLRKCWLFYLHQNE